MKLFPRMNGQRRCSSFGIGIGQELLSKILVATKRMNNNNNNFSLFISILEGDAELFKKCFFFHGHFNPQSVHNELIWALALNTLFTHSAKKKEMKNPIGKQT